jgi:hypothetical protein
VPRPDQSTSAPFTNSQGSVSGGGDGSGLSCWELCCEENMASDDKLIPSVEAHVKISLVAISCCWTTAAAGLHCRGAVDVQCSLLAQNALFPMAVPRKERKDACLRDDVRARCPRREATAINLEGCEPTRQTSQLCTPLTFACTIQSAAERAGSDNAVNALFQERRAVKLRH